MMCVMVVLFLSIGVGWECSYVFGVSIVLGIREYVLWIGSCDCVLVG